MYVACWMKKIRVRIISRHSNINLVLLLCLHHHHTSPQNKKQQKAKKKKNKTQKTHKKKKKLVQKIVVKSPPTPYTYLLIPQGSWQGNKKREYGAYPNQRQGAHPTPQHPNRIPVSIVFLFPSRFFLFSFGGRRQPNQPIHHQLAHTRCLLLLV